MTRFGHKLNYVINTFVKHTPEPYMFLKCHLYTSDVVVLAKEIYECWLVAEDIILLTRKIIYTYFIVSESIYMWKRGSWGRGAPKKPTTFIII